ncbi:hypothetical protein RJ639_045519 [Escallonia herrerae]|uniref:MATH domain-containing protein n=1 Tax=Escallonia herrerae TaxID=1293975 RepID=A0AA89B0S1_9ASTE|nr:hypothetical protein RJ639_045519 [Escallonia herrerae]
MEDRSLNPFLVSNVDRISSSLTHDHQLFGSGTDDYILKVEAFSRLPDMLLALEVDAYGSGIFEAGGYKWRMHLYPDGDKIHDADGYVSLYLVLAEEANSLPMGWEIDVNFRLFVHDQIRDRYYTIQDVNGKVRRFTEMKTQHGFAKLISLATFRDNANGYLVCDTCLFGAEVFVIQNTKRARSCISMEQSEYSSSPVSWKVHNFSKLNHGRILELFPRGDESHKGKLSIYLHVVDSTTSFGYNYVRDWWFGRDRISTRWPWDGGVLGEFTVRVIDQFDSPPIPETGPLKFANSCRSMISLTSSRFAAALDDGMWKLFISTPGILHLLWLWKV